jgi:hypothetical protein
MSKGSYLFRSIQNNGTIWFVGKNGSKSILYPISSNTQWWIGLIFEEQVFMHLLLVPRYPRKNFSLFVMFSYMV